MEDKIEKGASFVLMHVITHQLLEEKCVNVLLL